MKYKINIQKLVENPQYTEQLAKWQEAEKQGTYTRNYDTYAKPEPFIFGTALDVEITDAQFEAIRKAVLEVF
jgi:hypothetical protein